MQPPDLTACPDDNVLARLLERTLSDAERAGLELHLDDCKPCRELLGQLGRAYTEPAPNAAARAEPPRERSWVWLAPFELVAALVQGAIALAAALIRTDSGALAVALEAGCVWASGSLLLALAAAFGAWRRAPWALPIARIHAILALPSIVLTPLSACILRELRETRSARD